MTDWRLPLADVRLSEDVIAAAGEALRSNWLTMGPRTQELEGAFAGVAGTEHGVAVSSGSAGLHLACLAAGVGPGDEVIVPAVGFVADAHAAHWCGGTTVFADVVSAQEPHLDVDAVEALMNERTRAVIAVHMFGYPMELDRLARICRERGVVLIEDCCESAGATFADGTSVGTVGSTGIFSFFAKTQLPVGEGGLIVTDDKTASDRMRLLRSHAMTSVTWDRHRGHAETYDITDIGFNYRIDEPRAAMAHAHLGELEGRLEKLRGTVALYRERLEGVEGVELPFTSELVSRGGHFAFPIAVADNDTRHRVRMALCEQMIQTTFYPALTTLEIFEEAGRANPCPKAEDYAGRHLAMPLSCTMDADDVALACSELEAAISTAVVA